MPVGSSGREFPVGPALLMLAVAVLPFACVSLSRRAIAEQQRAILYRADHVAVLAAARDLLALRAPGSDPAGEFFLTADDPRLPAPIRALQPSGVYVEPERVLILFGGGPFAHELEAFPEGAAPPARGRQSVDLLPGLRYSWDGRRPLPPP